MASITFYFMGNVTIIQCDILEKMKIIFQRFASKLELDVKNIYFLYNGQKLMKN